MALPIIAAIARMGITQAIKKFGKGAVKRAQAAEKKVSGTVGKTPKGAKNRAKNDPRGNKPTLSAVRSGRRRIGTGVATTAAAVGIPKVGGALSDSIASDYKKPPAKKPTAKKSTGNFKAQPKAVEGKGTNLGKMQRDNAKMDANQKVTTSANKQKTAAVKRATVDAPVSKAPPKAKSDQSTSAPSWNQYKTIAQAKKAGSKFYSKNGKKMAAVYKEDLKPGQSLSDYMNNKNKLPKLKQSKAKIKKPKGFMSGKTVRGNGIAARSKTCKMR